MIVTVPPVAIAPLPLVKASTVQFADLAPWRSEEAKLTEPTKVAWDTAGPFSPARCVSMGGAVLGLATAAEVVLANSGSEIAPEARIANR
ncbi:MAG: hypothetical protein ABSA65_18860 [Acidimicrobiales bacterium]|jgi:hypothetical protein